MMMSEYTIASKCLNKCIPINELHEVYRSAACRQERLISSWREVSAAMDQIQKYLGHGSGRIDLAEVYLKGI